MFILVHVHARVCVCSYLFISVWSYMSTYSYLSVCSCLSFFLSVHIYLSIHIYLFPFCLSEGSYLYVHICSYMSVKTYSSLCLYLPFISFPWSLFTNLFANGPGDLGSIPGRVIPKTQKMVLDASLLNTQHYKVRIKGKVEQSREGVAPSPTPWCSSCRKGSLRDYPRLWSPTYL